MLEDKTAVVTGASNGIGRSIALSLSEHGANVVNADLKREERTGETPTDELVDEGDTTGLFVETDVSDPESVDDLFGDIESTFDSLDVVVNNAGRFKDGRAADLDVELWQGQIDVMLTGTFLCTKKALPLLLASDGGSIVNISSVAGLQATAARPAYCAAKGGITNLTRQVAYDYAEEGVRVNSVHPGLIAVSSTEPLRDTDAWQESVDNIPMGRVGEPDEIAEVVTFLASEKASYVTGAAYVADGGLTSFYG